MPTRKTSIRHAEIVRLFAARLRELRASRGLTQGELARQAVVILSYISRLENGGAAPGIDLVARLAEALGTTVADLLPAEVPPDTADLLHQRAKRLFDAVLPKADRETLQLLVPFLARLAES